MEFLASRYPFSHTELINLTRFDTIIWTGLLADRMKREAEAMKGKK